MGLASARDKPGTFIYGNKSKQVVFVVGGKTAGSVDVTDIPICLALSNDGAEIIASTADGSVHFISTSDLKIKKLSIANAKFLPPRSRRTTLLTRSRHTATTRLNYSSQRIIPVLFRVTGRTTGILTHWPSRRTANTWFLDLMTASLPFGCPLIIRSSWIRLPTTKALPPRRSPKLDLQRSGQTTASRLGRLALPNLHRLIELPTARYAA